MSQASYQKRMREKARQEKQQLKRERREQRAAEAAAAAEAGPVETPDGPPQERVLAKLAELHKQFDDEQIDFDEFEERKAELIAQLSV